MSTPYEAARLNLQLFEMRREPVLREARHWWLDAFTPKTFEELLAIAGGERNSSFRMVAGYWDMAASMVMSGAIDAHSFRAAHAEIWATVSKVYPFLEQLRAASGIPEFMRNAEKIVAEAPGGIDRLQMLREQFLARVSS